MDLVKNNWFTESCEMWPGGTFSLEVKEVLYSERSQYQNIHVFDTTSFGIVLVLDGIIQCTQKDEFSYQASIFCLIPSFCKCFSIELKLLKNNLRKVTNELV